MNSRSQRAGKPLSARELCLLALMGALIFAAKFALAALPNVNLNTLLIILTVIFFGARAFYAVGVYVLLEGLVFGFTLWWFSYLYAWPVVTLVLLCFRKNDSTLVWAVLAGLVGLLFGPLMYILYFIVNGWHLVLSMWIAGIPYDLIHGVSNFVLTLALYRPLRRVMERYLTIEE